jgi:photosystem II stability/assembly factor-like uncharacterized protein
MQTITADTVNALAASPAMPGEGVCFAAQNSGLYRSTDRGRTWQFAYQSLAPEQPIATTAVAVSPHFAYDSTVFAGAPGGLLRSGDGGLTWRTTLLPQPAPLVSAIAVSPQYADDGVLFAATLQDGVFRSSDRGNTWAAWNFGLYDRSVFCLAVSPHYGEDESVYAGTSSALFRSANGGRSWRELAFPLDWAPVLSLALSMNADGRQVIWAGTETCGLFSSTDEGRTCARHGAGAFVGAVNMLLAATGRPTLVALVDDQVWVSLDHGAAWVQAGDAPGSVTALAFGVPGQETSVLAGLYEGGVVAITLPDAG